MTTRRSRIRVATTALAVVLGLLASYAPAGAADVLAPEIVQALTTSPYVYIATQRKDGTFGTPSEIWFMYDQGAVWMASPTTAWRVRRIRAGRTTAKIAVGKKDGATFTAKGSFVRDPAAYERLYVTYAKKYPQGWPQYETRFRDGLKDGSRVLMRYEPIAAAAAVPMAAPATKASTAKPSPISTPP